MAVQLLVNRRPLNITKKYGSLREECLDVYKVDLYDVDGTGYEHCFATGAEDMFYACVKYTDLVQILQLHANNDHGAAREMLLDKTIYVGKTQANMEKRSYEHATSTQSPFDRFVKQEIINGVRYAEAAPNWINQIEQASILFVTSLNSKSTRNLNNKIEIYRCDNGVALATFDKLLANGKIIEVRRVRHNKGKVFTAQRNVKLQ